MEMKAVRFAWFVLSSILAAWASALAYVVSILI